jgi:hypothetical protein
MKHCYECGLARDLRTCPTETCSRHYVCFQCGSDVHTGERLTDYLMREEEGE